MSPSGSGVGDVTGVKALVLRLMPRSFIAVMNSTMIVSKGVLSSLSKTAFEEDAVKSFGASVLGVVHRAHV